MTRAALVVAAFAALFAARAAQAAVAPGDPRPAAAGGAIAAQGVAARGVPACIGCHGARGEGNAALKAPALAGQAEPYLARQLAAYADGSRRHPVMQPIAQGLDAQARAAVAAFYAGLTPPAPPAPGRAPDTVLARGRALATRGDAALGVQACANCHGPGGAGEPPAYPALAGQSREYLLAALEEWQQGARSTDPSGQMPSIAKRLAAPDVAALASFFAASRPARMAAAPPLPAARDGAAVRSGPVATGGGGAKAAGTEQAEPTQGGSQGVGGGGGTTTSEAEGRPAAPPPPSGTRPPRPL
jgi:cytochrome c553